MFLLSLWLLQYVNKTADLKKTQKVAPDFKNYTLGFKGNYKNPK